MTILEYIVISAALFFSVIWAAGLTLRPEYRTKANIVTVLHWLLEIAVLYEAGRGALLHLIWLMPVTAILCMKIQAHMVQGGLELALKKGHMPPPVSLSALFIVASIILTPVLWLIA